MGVDPRRSIVQEMIGRLVRDRRGFGERPWSFYSPKEPEHFISYALRLTPVEDLLPYSPVGAAGQELTPGQQHKLKEILDRVDRYGLLLTGWKQGQPIPPDCLADLRSLLRFWTFRHVPEYCWEKLDLPAVVDKLQDALRASASTYNFSEELFVWAIPVLTRRLGECVQGVVRQLRAGVELDRLRPRLQARAQDILACLDRAYGLGGISASDVTERALLLLLCADDAEYRDHRLDLWGWAQAKLRVAIRLQAQFNAEPDLGPGWDAPEKIDRELQRRRTLLQVFYEVVE